MQPIVSLGRILAYTKDRLLGLLCLTVGSRSLSGMLFKVAVKVGGFRKTQSVTNLFGRHLAIAKHGPGLSDELFNNPLVYGLTGFAFNHMTEVVGMKALLIGIILYLVVVIHLALDERAEMSFHALLKLLHDL